MKTKTILLVIAALIVAVCSAKAQVTKTIDFDYQKAFVFTTIGMDANMNGKPDTGESFAGNGKSTFYINHKDYGSAGSRTDIEIMLVAKGKKVTKTNVDFEDGVMIVDAELENRKEQKYEPKDGDFVYVKAGYEHIAIFKEKVDEDMYVYANWNMSLSVSKIIIDDSRPLCCIQKLREIRPATEREKKILIDKLAKVNKRWNPETKTIEDARWRAKDGEPYSYLLVGDTDILVTTTTDMRIYKDDERFNSGNYFKTVEAAEKVAEQIWEIFKNSKAE